MELNEIFSRSLVAYRKLRGISQRELAKKTGLTLRMISFYENNPKSVPFSSLKILAEHLNVNVTDFFPNGKKKENIFDNLDVRWLKKIITISQLSEFDRKELNRYLNYLVNRAKITKKA